MKKILSIDFDYFQDVPDENVFAAYPDGIDLPTDISTIVWASKYAFKRDAEKILSVRPLEKELSLLHSLLMKQDQSIPIMVRQSHLEIYKWIHQIVPEGEQLILHNIDMHHDLFNNNPNIDCGNWISYIFEEYGRENVKFRWIANPKAVMSYGFDYSQEGQYISTSLIDIINQQYDYIFLCRSDNWFPPHLDNSFDAVLKTIAIHFSNKDVEIQKRQYNAIIQMIKRSMC